jgi:hypothetical protein
MGRVRPGLQMRSPTAAAQNPLAIQIKFFIFVSPSLFAALKLDAAKGYYVFRCCEFRGNMPKGYTSSMDSVRFGRALGFGARAAAKTLVTAVDAATSPNPSAGEKTQTAPTESKAAASGVRLGEQAARTATQVQQTKAGLAQGGKRFGEAAWGPFVKLSGVLWLEFTGVFFGIFALFAASGAWKMRNNLHETASNHEAHVHFLLMALMAAVFGYFFVSSFVKAHLRSRRH